MVKRFGFLQFHKGDVVFYNHEYSVRLFYVGDIIVIGDETRATAHLKRYLLTHFETKDLGDFCG